HPHKHTHTLTHTHTRTPSHTHSLTHTHTLLHTHKHTHTHTHAHFHTYTLTPMEPAPILPSPGQPSVGSHGGPDLHHHPRSQPGCDSAGHPQHHCSQDPLHPSAVCVCVWWCGG